MPTPAAEWFYRWATAYRQGDNGFDRMPTELREAELDNATAAMNEIQGAHRGAGHLGSKALREIATPAVCVVGEENAHPWYRRTTEFVAQNLPGAVVRRLAHDSSGVDRQALERPQQQRRVLRDSRQ
jgi:hypothetical protein